jgi:Family of unknown function (DUF6454)
MIRKAIGFRLAAFSLLLTGLTVSAAPPTFPEGIEHAQLQGTLPLNGALFHVQGVELDSAHIWVTSVDRWNRRGYIHEFNRASGALVRRVELTDQLRFHPGGISILGDSIWVPMAELRPNSSAVLLELNRESFQVKRRIEVADHLGCVAAASDTLIAGNWDSRLFYVFDLTGAKPMYTIPNPTRTAYQDIKLIDGQLVAGGTLTQLHGTIDWFEWPALRLVRTLKTGATLRADAFPPVRAYTGEGMALEGRDLYLVPEDGPSRMFHFKLDEDIPALVPKAEIAAGV